MQSLTEPPVTAIERSHLRICVLDDDPDQVELAVEWLQKSGFPATGTVDPLEALQKVRLGECRVALVDLKMPSMDGFAFLENVLRFDPGMYVILATGFYAVDSAIEAIKRGAYDYVCKPLDRSRLTKTLD